MFSSYRLTGVSLKSIPSWDRLCCKEMLGCAKRRNLIVLAGKGNTSRERTGKAARSGYVPEL